MDRARKLEKRRELSAKRTAQNNYNKFIAEYVKAKYKDIYMEADQLYQSVKEKTLPERT